MGRMPGIGGMVGTEGIREIEGIGGMGRREGMGGMPGIGEWEE